ncbi:MAG: dTDP-4-amino-4,6-dideoxygalactose transaminase [Roseivirga sp.]
MIPYNRPYKSGAALDTIRQAFKQENLGGDGNYTHLCQQKLEQQYGFGKCLLTHSCSAALEIAARVCDFQPGDEVIVPSFAYVTTASAFTANGATVRFAESQAISPHIDPEAIAELINPKTRALVIVHYAGAACDMKAVMDLVRHHKLLLIEDCAHAINAKYEGKYLGTFGQLATFSFHETKNIHCGEGGMLIVNDERLTDKSVSIWHEGTDRQNFKKGLTAKYEWTHLGSSYQPSELTAGFLYAQLEDLAPVTAQRIALWERYHDALAETTDSFTLPVVRSGHNAHIFYLKCPSQSYRNALIAHLNTQGVMAIFHYLPLHQSPYWLQSHKPEVLKEAEAWADCIVRLPLFYDLTAQEQDHIIESIQGFNPPG